MKLMIFTMTCAGLVGPRHNTTEAQRDANFKALKEAFGLDRAAIRVACEEAQRHGDKVKVVCTPAQFGSYIHRRCALGGRNLIQELEAHELPDDKAEPGIGSHGTVFFVADGTVRTERFDCDDPETTWVWPWSYSQAESRMHRAHIKPEIYEINYADIEKRCMAHYAAGVMKHGNDAWDASAWTGHPPKEPLKNDESDIFRQIKWMIGWPWDISKPQQAHAAAPGLRPYQKEAMETLKRGISYGIRKELAMGYNMGPSKWKAGEDIYMASAKQMEIQRLNGLAAQHEENEAKWARAASRCGTEKGIRGCLRTADRHHESARALRASATRLADELARGRPAKPTEYTLGDLIAFQKDAVRRGDLEWHHVKAVKRAFGVEHTNELKPEQYRCVYDALRAVIAARASGIPAVEKLKATVEEQAKNIAGLRTELHEAKIELVNKPSAFGYFGLVKAKEDAERALAEEARQRDMYRDLLKTCEGQRNEAQQALAACRSEYSDLKESNIRWERGYNWVKSLLEKAVPKETHDKKVAELETKLADRDRMHEYLSGEIRELNARVAAAEEGPTGAQLSYVRQMERESIVAHMEQRSNELYRQAQDSSPSAAEKLRASCYSLRNHAQQICKRIF